MDLNKFIDMLFNETTINQELIAEEIPNIQIRNYIYSILQEFKPEEILKIFNNTNCNNSSLILLYKENLQSLLHNQSIASFTNAMPDMINEPELATLNYAIATYLTNTNPINYASLYSTALKQLIFYPHQNNLPFALDLIETITMKLFKCIDNKQFFLCELYTPEYFPEDILVNAPKGKEAIAQMMVIYFVFQYHINFNIFREKFMMLFDNPSGNAQAINSTRESFRKLAYFQEKFYSNFSLIQLHREVFITNKVDIPKLENAIVLIMSSIGQFFPQYRTYKITPPLEELTLQGQLDRLEDILMKIDSNSNWSNWLTLFYQNPYLIAIGTVNYIALGTCKADSYNYYDTDDLYECFRRRYAPNGDDSINNSIELFIKCLIVIYVLFNMDMKKFSFCIEEDQMKMQSNIIQFNTNVIILLWKIKTQLPPGKYRMIKYDFYLLLNDILYYREACLSNIVSNNDLFDEKLIQYIIEDIESAHMCSKYFNDFFSSKDADKILNGFLLFGHWATKYPIRYIHAKLIEVLSIFKSTIDLRSVLISEANINKFTKGIYLLFKAFPKVNEEFIAFIKYIRSSVGNWINDMSLLNYAIQSIDKVHWFANHGIVNAGYCNKNTGLISFTTV